MKRTIKNLLLCFIVLVLTVSTSMAHSGRTDSSGGHWNRKTGTYHYHNSGYTPTTTNTTSSTSRTKTTTRVYTPKPPATPQADYGITVYVNGKRILFDVPPHVFEGRTLVPLRTIFEALGYGITWDEDTKTIRSTGKDKEIVLTVGDKYATVGGSWVELDVKVQTIKNTTFVPLRFIAESANATIDWEASTKTIRITSN